MLDGKAGHDAGEAEDAADREIEHAGDQEHHHPAGEDAGLRRVEEHDGRVRRAHERGRLQNGHQRQKGNDQADQQELPLGSDEDEELLAARTFFGRLFDRFVWSGGRAALRREEVSLHAALS